MTVGIGAIAMNDGDPHVIVSADRMVTYGQQSGVEYEDTNSKIESIISNDQVNAVAVGSGSTTYIDEVIKNIRRTISNSDQNIRRINNVLNHSLSGLKYTVQDSISNQILAPFGYSLNDLRDSDTEIPAEIQKGIFEQTANLREQIANEVHLLIAGVGVDGPGVYLLHGTDYTNFNDMGYGIIGSGSDSARLTFIRRRYDRKCSVREGVFTVLEAKNQSEERQGVGQQMDLVLLSGDQMDVLDDTEIMNLREFLEDIEEAEQNARENVIDDWEYI